MTSLLTSSGIRCIPNTPLEIDKEIQELLHGIGWLYLLVVLVVLAHSSCLILDQLVVLVLIGVGLPRSIVLQDIVDQAQLLLQFLLLSFLYLRGRFPSKHREQHARHVIVDSQVLVEERNIAQADLVQR